MTREVAIESSGGSRLAEDFGSCKAKTLRTRFRRRHERTNCACDAICVVMGVMHIGAIAFDVRARVGAKPALHERREREHHLSDRKKNDRRSPKGAGQHSGGGHERHTRLMVAVFRRRRNPRPYTYLHSQHSYSVARLIVEIVVGGTYIAPRTPDVVDPLE